MDADAPRDTAWRDAAVTSLRYHKQLADRAIAQIDDAALHRTLDEHAISIAALMQHVGGNLRSRWTDFLASDGEEPWRDRDAEFTDAGARREELTAAWEEGWRLLFDSHESLTAADFERCVLIRGERLSVPLAVQRSLAHTCYHVGQILVLARHWAGDRWTTLTIPRGGAAAYNDAAWGRDDYKGQARGKKD